MATEINIVLFLEAGRVFRVEIPRMRRGYKFVAGRSGNMSIPIENLVGLKILLKSEDGKLLGGVKKEDEPKDIGKSYELIIKDYPDGSSRLIIQATLPQGGGPEVISVGSAPIGSDTDSIIKKEAEEASVLSPPPEFPFFLADYLKDVEDSIIVTQMDANATGCYSDQDNNVSSDHQAGLSSAPGSSNGSRCTIDRDNSGVNNDAGTRGENKPFTPSKGRLVPY